MKRSFEKIVAGYKTFRARYSKDRESLMKLLGTRGQNPEIMVIACSDSRVDPAILLQCDPGDLFVVRNIANIVPPYEKDDFHHGTSAALEFGVCYLGVKHLIILGHSSCAGIQVKTNSLALQQNDFISNWIDQIAVCADSVGADVDGYAKASLLWSHENCLTFPWLKQRIVNNELKSHLWYLDIATAQIYEYDFNSKQYLELSENVD